MSDHVQRGVGAEQIGAVPVERRDVRETDMATGSSLGGGGGERCLQVTLLVGWRTECSSSQRNDGDRETRDRDCGPGSTGIPHPYLPRHDLCSVTVGGAAT